MDRVSVFARFTRDADARSNRVTEAFPVLAAAVAPPEADAINAAGLATVGDSTNSPSPLTIVTREQDGTDEVPYSTKSLEESKKLAVIISQSGADSVTQGLTEGTRPVSADDLICQTWRTPSLVVVRTLASSEDCNGGPALSETGTPEQIRIMTGALAVRHLFRFSTGGHTDTNLSCEHETSALPAKAILVISVVCPVNLPTLLPCRVHILIPVRAVAIRLPSSLAVTHDKPLESVAISVIS